MPLAASSPFRRYLAIALVALLALAPLLYIVDRTEPARRNIVYWDEFDTALAMLLRIAEKPDSNRFVSEMLALNNEHRMVTSRLLFASNYAATGRINFDFINFVGNLSLLGLIALLVVHARTLPRRLAMLAVLAALFFQLEHYENFMWSGASIDHFQVVLLAAAALVCVARNTWPGIVGGAVFASLATFTLAHGIVTWAVGALLLWRARNRAGLALWCGLAALGLGGFFLGFQANQSHGFATFSGAGVVLVIRYWLTLLGAVPALGNSAVAPWLGLVLLAVIVRLVRRNTLRHQPVAFALILFALGALALIAVGRAQVSGGVIFSRYYVLGATAWGMALYIVLTRYAHPRSLFLPLGWALPVLVVFNVAGNRAFSVAADSWVECRDRAAVRFLQHGADGRGSFTLHPRPEHSTLLLKQAARAGIYAMPPLCQEIPFPENAKPSTRLIYFVDDMTVNDRSVYVTGWAALRDVKSERHQIHLVLRNAQETHLFTTVTESRPDVAKATKQPSWELSGFQFVRLRDRLPDGEFQIGFLIDGPDGPEFTMTAHRVDLTGEGKALLVTGGDN
ncbi:MAG: hypothetical protein V4773_11070 [Verrucomicrobiota bacterium]